MNWELQDVDWHVVFVRKILHARDVKETDTKNFHGAKMLNGVKFDGIRDGVLLDAKGKYAQFISKKTGEFYTWFKGKQGLIDEAMRQISASDGARIQWFFAEEKTMNVVRELFEKNGISGIELIFEAIK